MIPSGINSQPAEVQFMFIPEGVKPQINSFKGIQAVILIIKEMFPYIRPKL